MGTTTLQINFNSQRMIDLGKIMKQRGISSDKSVPGYLSPDSFARVLLLEYMDRILKSQDGV